MITKQQAIDLSLREIHYHDPTISIANASLETINSARNRCRKWRRNGATKTWKTRPDEFKVPIKFGLFDYGYLTQENAERFFLPEDCEARHK